jgi:glutamate/aspartate transport system substrate-binding protein
VSVRTSAILLACLAIALLPRGPAGANDDFPLSAVTASVLGENRGYRIPETMDRVKNSRMIFIGYRRNNIPFSYEDSSHQPTGYAKELCDRIVEAIRRELDIPQLMAIYRPVAAQERILMLQNGMIDLECGSTAITAEREKVVDFSLPYFISRIRALTRKAYGIRQTSDLANKTIVFTAGTTVEKIIREKLDPERNRITVLQGRSALDSILMIRTGRAMAYFTGDHQLAGLIANSRDPNTYEIVDPPLSTEYLAIMMRKGERRLKASVDKTLIDIVASGEMRWLYDRWFMLPIPPSGANLNLPMGDELTQHLTKLLQTNSLPPGSAFDLNIYTWRLSPLPQPLSHRWERVAIAGKVPSFRRRPESRNMFKRSGIPN